MASRSRVLGLLLLIGGVALAIPALNGPPAMLDPAPTFGNPYQDKANQLEQGELDQVIPQEAFLEDQITPAESSRTQEIALSSDDVQALIEGHRYSVAASSLSELGLYDAKNEGCDGPRTCAEILLVDYTAAIAINVRVDLESAEVADVSTYPGVRVSARLPAEKSEALALAVSAPQVIAEIDGRAYSLWGDPNPFGTNEGPCSSLSHRCLHVRIKAVNDLLTVLVDLTDGRVDRWFVLPDWFQSP